RLGFTGHTPPGAESAANCTSKTLTVDRAADFVRPYVLPWFHGRPVMLPKTQTITFSTTADSSGGALSLLQHGGREATWLNARPHAFTALAVVSSFGARAMILMPRAAGNKGLDWHSCTNKLSTESTKPYFVANYGPKFYHGTSTRSFSRFRRSATRTITTFSWAL
ncbi:hypothetical protein LLEC1_02755, partial [Akanthomyces lecanii]